MKIILLVGFCLILISCGNEGRNAADFIKNREGYAKQYLPNSAENIKWRGGYDFSYVDRDTKEKITINLGSNIRHDIGCDHGDSGTIYVYE